jgi:soluble P-type ATPase
MTVQIDIPGRAPLELDHLLLDLNGTLTNRGTLIGTVTTRLRELSVRLEIELLSADTFGTLPEVAAKLGVAARRVESGAEKQARLAELGADRCAAVGNGLNDRGMLRDAALGIAVLGPEGAAAATLADADIVVASVADAIDLLLEPRTLAATLRI